MAEVSLVRGSIAESISECSKEDADAAFSQALGGVLICTEQNILNEIEQAQQLAVENALIEHLVKWTDSFNTTLLWYAARNGYSIVVSFLLRNGCDFMKARTQKASRFFLGDTSKSASTPLMVAILSLSYESAYLLLQHYRKNEVALSPEQAGNALLILATDCEDICGESLVSNVSSLLIEIVGFDINREIKVEYAGEKLPLISHAAARGHHASLIKKLLKHEFVTNRLNALFKAASAGNAEIVKLIILEGFQGSRNFQRGNISQNDLNWNNLSQAAILACESETSRALATISVLLTHGASLCYKTIYGETVVSCAVSRSNTDILKFALENGGDPKEGFAFLVNDEGSTESRACLSMLLEYLCKQSCSGNLSFINSKKDGIPVLSLTAMRCSETFIQMMLESGADLNLVDDIKSYTPLNWACSKDNISAAHALLKAGADPNVQNNSDYFTCLHTAVACGSTELVELLLSNGANPNLKTMEQGFTALHLAVERGSKDIIKMLLKFGSIDINQVDHDGTTPLADAVVKACSEDNRELIEIVKLLLDENASPDIKDLRGNTALISAVGGRNSELVKMLVEVDAELEATNEDKNSPLSLVAESLDDSMSMEIIKIMLNHELLHQDNRKLDIFLRDKTQQLLKDGKVQIIAALAVLMLQSTDTRKVITNSPGLWITTKSVPRRQIKYIPEDSDYLEKTDLPPENMLTWAIMNDSPAVRILLESKDKDITLPFNWRSSLIVEETKVGTPIRCAVDKKSISNISTMLSVLKSMWSYQFLSNSKQRNMHPLDNLQYQDLAYVMQAYPELMVMFLQDLPLVPAYSFVSGLSQAPISRSDIWVLSSKDRSPTSIWAEYLENVYKNSNFYKKVSEEVEAETVSLRSLNNTTDRLYQVIFLAWCYISRFNLKFNAWPFAKKIERDENVRNSNLQPLTFIDKVLLADEALNSEKDVKAYMIPVKCIASYAMVLACVQASIKLKSPILFDSPIMAAVVQLHWRLYGHRKHIFNLILYLLLLVVFIVLSYSFKYWVEKGGAGAVIGWILQIIKLSISLYFLCWQELKQMRYEHQENKLKAYFISVWNLMDLSIYGFIFIGFFLQVFCTDSVVADGIHSVVALMLWFKLLDFLRPFRRFGPIVNLIFEVTADIRIFLIILLIAMIGFGNAFSIILNSSSSDFKCDESDSFLQKFCEETYNDDGPFYTPFYAIRSSFAYMLGDFNFDDLDEGPLPVLLTIIWALFMFTVAIILFNLLIAIISESYERKSSTKMSSWRLEQAQVVIIIFSMLSAEDQSHWNNYIHNNPWLQVLIPKGLLDGSHDDKECMESVAVMYEVMQQMLSKLLDIEQSIKSLEKHTLGKS